MLNVKEATEAASCKRYNTHLSMQVSYRQYASKSLLFIFSKNLKESHIWVAHWADSE